MGVVAYVKRGPAVTPVHHLSLSGVTMATAAADKSASCRRIADSLATGTSGVHPLHQNSPIVLGIITDGL